MGNRAILAGIDHIAIVETFVEAVGLAGAGPLRRQPIEHDVEEKTKAVPRTQRGHVTCGILGRSADAQDRINRVKVGNDEGIAGSPRYEEGTCADVIEAQFAGARQVGRPGRKRTRLAGMKIVDFGC